MILESVVPGTSADTVTPSVSTPELPPALSGCLENPTVNPDIDVSDVSKIYVSPSLIWRAAPPSIKTTPSESRFVRATVCVVGFALEAKI